MTATAPLHSEPQSLPSVTRSDPSPEWADSVDRGREIMRAALIEQNLPGLRLASGQETGYGLGWDLETVTLAGEQTHVVGHDGDSLGGIVASLMTFRERELVVAVISNISYADTFSLSLNIAQAFAEQAQSPARR